MKVTRFGKRRIALPEPAMRGLQTLALRYHVTPEQLLEQVVVRLLDGRYEELEDIAAEHSPYDWTTERPRFATPAKVIDLAERRRRRHAVAEVRGILERARVVRERAACAVVNAGRARQAARAAVEQSHVARDRVAHHRRAG
jgi:hypothetical protein